MTNILVLGYTEQWTVKAVIKVKGYLLKKDPFGLLFVIFSEIDVITHSGLGLH